MKFDHTKARVHSIQGPKTTKYENESENEVRCRHKFAPVSRLTHAPAKIKSVGGGVKLIEVKFYHREGITN